MSMNMVPADVEAYATKHDDVSTQIGHDCQPSGMTAARMAAYGPVGAVFSTAVDAFEAAAAAHGEQLAASYAGMGTALRSAVEAVVSTDAANAAQIQSTTTRCCEGR
jgi:hypothetical protein